MNKLILSLLFFPLFLTHSYGNESELCTVEQFETRQCGDNYYGEISDTCPKDQWIVSGSCTDIPLLLSEDEPDFDCLIATASYGSELAPQVQMLREVRDNILLSTYSGALFMDGFNAVYYSFSPQVAQLENENLVFKESVKLFITPMISTLSIMTLANENSEEEVIFLGMSAIGIIVCMYIVAPTIVVWQIRKRI